MGHGVAYYFASEEAMNAFTEVPETYIPQFGYCALDVAVGAKLDCKLCLFLKATVFQT